MAMTLVGIVLYTGILLASGYHAKRRRPGGFWDGGHQISTITTFILVTALWASSCIVVEIDTAYAVGWSAAWYGVSIFTLSVLVALLLPFFQSRSYISNSGLLGAVYGPAVRRLSGLIIGITFPIFAMSNAVFSAVFFHVLWAWPMAWSLAITTAVLIASIQFAGMRSLAATQGSNLVLMMGSLVMIAWIMHQQPLTHPVPILLANRLMGWESVGLPTILVWFGMNWLNVFAAQAEFQMLAASRYPGKVRMIVGCSSAVLLGVVGISTWIGLRLRMLAPRPGPGALVHLAVLLTRHAQPWQMLVIGLGIWAMALSWCSPLLFSGAISLGADVMPQKASMMATKWALGVEGALMIAYALWRPGEMAWWRVFGLTLRNAGVVGPTVGLLLWGDDMPSTVITWAMVSAVGVGFVLNALTGFSPVHFVDGVNPMWAAQTVSFLILAAGRWSAIKQLRHGIAWLAGALLMMVDVACSAWSAGALRGILLLGISAALVGLTWHLTAEHAPGDGVSLEAGDF
ncbi:hypothetical protein BXT84_07840 [Sulfobacillus thermotolerans]|uniref:Sodium:solute symporter n=1 Tax=Sulfobacillus thermotolerans TaxID=338644 RepID=A0ABM6RR16_9FIRM|nr:hypothetical protein BXT84_07840 [Sulfobacillus thermotolerans]